MAKTVIVDVDSTLWDFLGEFKKRAEEIYPEKFPNGYPEVTSWDQPIETIGLTPAIDIFNSIHEDQNKFAPFEGAHELLAELSFQGYKVVIASNRPPEMLRELRHWLTMHELHFDEVFADHDKSVLFGDDSIQMLIDDRPSTQEEALSLKWNVLTLEYEYNKHIQGTIKFRCLKRMAKFLYNINRTAEKALQSE